MTSILKTIGLCIVFFLAFLVLTFPFNRLAPKMRSMIEKSLSSGFGINAICTLEDFDLKLPFGVQWSKLVCVDDIANQKIVDLGESTLTLLPKRQVITAELGKGSLKLKMNAGFSSPPTRIEGEFNEVPVEKIMPLVMGAANRANPQIPKYLKAEGKISGSVDWPLKNLQKEKGKIDLQFPGLKFPQQSQLDLIGVKDLAFSKSSVKVGLTGGKMTFTEVNFSSQQLSGKVDGSMDINEDFKKSSGAMNLKWKIEKSDAVLSSLLGPMIANNCPSPDTEGFCTRRITRMTEMGM